MEGVGLAFWSSPADYKGGWLVRDGLIRATPRLAGSTAKTREAGPNPRSGAAGPA